MQRIEEVRGDDWTYTVSEITDGEGQPVSDLTPWNCELTIANRPGADPLLTKSTTAGGITRDTDQNGRPCFVVSIPRTETLLNPGSYFLKVVLIAPDGTRQTTQRISLSVVA